MYIYESYRKIKTGVSLFLDHSVYKHTVAMSSALTCSTVYHKFYSIVRQNPVIHHTVWARKWLHDYLKKAPSIPQELDTLCSNHNIRRPMYNNATEFFESECRYQQTYRTTSTVFLVSYLLPDLPESTAGLLSHQRSPDQWKLAPCGTDGRLLLRARLERHIPIFFQIQSHVTQKLGQISKIWPDQI